MNVTGVIIIMYKIHLEEVSLNMYNYYGAKTKHKVFISFYHKDDQKYKDYRGIIRMCGGVAAPGGTPHPCSA